MLRRVFKPSTVMRRLANVGWLSRWLALHFVFNCSPLFAICLVRGQFGSWRWHWHFRVSVSLRDVTSPSWVLCRRRSYPFCPPCPFYPLTPRPSPLSLRVSLSDVDVTFAEIQRNDLHAFFMDEAKEGDLKVRVIATSVARQE